MMNQTGLDLSWICTGLAWFWASDGLFIWRLKKLPLLSSVCVFVRARDGLVTEMFSLLPFTLFCTI